MPAAGVGWGRARVPAVEAVHEVGAGPEAGLDRIEGGHPGTACPVDAARDHLELPQGKHIIIESLPQPRGRDPDEPGRSA